MQSLVQEAATIEKAVAQAWRKAGQPQQFQIKVLEEPERNFLGMVTRSAKVAIMFDMPQVAQPASEKQAPKKSQQKKQPAEKRESDQKSTEQKDQKPQHKQRESQQTEKKQPESTTRHKQHEQTQKAAAQKQQQKGAQKQAADKQPQAAQSKQDEQQSSSQQSKQSKNKRPQSLWTQERVEHAQKWLRNVLDNMGYTDISFTAEPQNLYLRIELSDHLLTRKDREKQLLASLASLMMATMQQQYKKAFRGHKVVLTHP